MTTQYGPEGMYDPVNRPAHYSAGGIEAIDVVEAFDLGFHLGNVLKYILRAGRKDNHLLDLKKARWLLDRQIAREEKQAREPERMVPRMAEHGVQSLGGNSFIQPPGDAIGTAPSPLARPRDSGRLDTV